MFSTKSVGEHAKIVQEKSKLRHLIDAAGTIADNAYSERESVQDIVDDAERRILEVARMNERVISSLSGKRCSMHWKKSMKNFRTSRALPGFLPGLPSWMHLPADFRKAIS